MTPQELYQKLLEFHKAGIITNDEFCLNKDSRVAEYTFKHESGKKLTFQQDFKWDGKHEIKVFIDSKPAVTNIEESPEVKEVLEALKMRFAAAKEAEGKQIVQSYNVPYVSGVERKFIPQDNYFLGTAEEGEDCDIFRAVDAIIESVDGKKQKNFKEIVVEEGQILIGNDYNEEAKKLYSNYGVTDAVDSGSTLCAAKCSYNDGELKIDIANLGDSRAFLVLMNKEGKKIILSLTEDMDAKSERFKKSKFMPMGRLGGSLAVFGAVGDKGYLRCGLIKTPDKSEYRFKEISSLNDSFEGLPEDLSGYNFSEVIVCSDGVIKAEAKNDNMLGRDNLPYSYYTVSKAKDDDKKFKVKQGCLVKPKVSGFSEIPVLLPQFDIPTIIDATMDKDDVSIARINLQKLQEEGQTVVACIFDGHGEKGEVISKALKRGFENRQELQKIEEEKYGQVRTGVTATAPLRNEYNLRSTSDSSGRRLSTRGSQLSSGLRSVLNEPLPSDRALLTVPRAVQSSSETSLADFRKFQDFAKKILPLVNEDKLEIPFETLRDVLVIGEEVNFETEKNLSDKEKDQFCGIIDIINQQLSLNAEIAKSREIEPDGKLDAGNGTHKSFKYGKNALKNILALIEGREKEVDSVLAEYKKANDVAIAYNKKEKLFHASVVYQDGKIKLKIVSKVKEVSGKFEAEGKLLEATLCTRRRRMEDSYFADFDVVKRKKSITDAVIESDKEEFRRDSKLELLYKVVERAESSAAVKDAIMKIKNIKPLFLKAKEVHQRTSLLVQLAGGSVDLEIVKLLVDEGLNPCYGMTEGGSNPLYEAAKYCDFDVVEFLYSKYVKKGYGNLNKISEFQEEKIIAALVRKIGVKKESTEGIINKIKIASFLINKECEVTQDELKSLILKAAEHGLYGAVKNLCDCYVQQGGDLNQIKDDKERTVIEILSDTIDANEMSAAGFLAINNVVDFLTSKGCEVNMVDMAKINVVGSKILKEDQKMLEEFGIVMQGVPNTIGNNNNGNRVEVDGISLRSQAATALNSQVDTAATVLPESMEEIVTAEVLKLQREEESAKEIQARIAQEEKEEEELKRLQKEIAELRAQGNDRYNSSPSFLKELGYKFSQDGLVMMVKNKENVMVTDVVILERIKAKYKDIIDRQKEEELKIQQELQERIKELFNSASQLFGQEVKIEDQDGFQGFEIDEKYYLGRRGDEYGVFKSNMLGIARIVDDQLANDDFYRIELKIIQKKFAEFYKSLKEQYYPVQTSDVGRYKTFDCGSSKYKVAEDGQVFIGDYTLEVLDLQGLFKEINTGIAITSTSPTPTLQQTSKSLSSPLNDETKVEGVRRIASDGVQDEAQAKAEAGRKAQQQERLQARIAQQIQAKKAEEEVARQKAEAEAKVRAELERKAAELRNREQESKQSRPQVRMTEKEMREAEERESKKRLERIKELFNSASQLFGQEVKIEGKDGFQGFKIDEKYYLGRKGDEYGAFQEMPMVGGSSIIRQIISDDELKQDLPKIEQNIAWRKMRARFTELYKEEYNCPIETLSIESCQYNYKAFNIENNKYRVCENGLVLGEDNWEIEDTKHLEGLLGAITQQIGGRAQQEEQARIAQQIQAKKAEEEVARQKAEVGRIARQQEQLRIEEQAKIAREAAKKAEEEAQAKAEAGRKAQQRRQLATEEQNRAAQEEVEQGLSESSAVGSTASDLSGAIVADLSPITIESYKKDELSCGEFMQKEVDKGLVFYKVNNADKDSNSKFDFSSHVDNIANEKYIDHVSNLVGRAIAGMQPQDKNKIIPQDAINFIFIAIKNGGIGNISSKNQNSTEDELYKEIEKLYSEKSGIEKMQYKRLAIRFSRLFQDLCKESEMFTGNQLSPDLYGLRLKRIHPDSVQQIAKNIGIDNPEEFVTDIIAKLQTDLDKLKEPRRSISRSTASPMSVVSELEEKSGIFL